MSLIIACFRLAVKTMGLSYFLSLDMGGVSFVNLGLMDESSTQETTPSSTSAPMNKTVIYAIVAVVILALVGGVYAFKHQIKTALMGQQETSQTSQTPQTNQTPAENTSGVMEKRAIVEVDYTDSGFSPASVTVKKGTTVKFINKQSLQSSPSAAGLKSGSGMDVASNPHPVHTDYLGFDQGKSSQKGQNEYDFTFDKVGTWEYHNHLNSSDTGTIVVTE